MTDAAVKAREGIGVGLVVLAAEGGLRAQEAGLREGEEAPEIGEAILYRRAGEDETMPAQEGAGD